MKINLVIITHDNVGSSLLNAALQTFGNLPLPSYAVSIQPSQNPEDMITTIKNFIAKLNPVKGILILTDLLGSTPANIARALQNHLNIKVVSGVNLPMIIRIMNYPNLALEQLAEKALSGGKEGVMDCSEYLCVETM